MENLAIADEVLRNPAQTFCRKGLIAFLKERYVTIEALNQAWKTDFGSFAALEGPVVDCSARYPGSRKDIREFSGKLITEYIRYTESFSPQLAPAFHQNFVDHLLFRFPCHIVITCATAVRNVFNGATA